MHSIGCLNHSGDVIAVAAAAAALAFALLLARLGVAASRLQAEADALMIEDVKTYETSWTWQWHVKLIYHMRPKHPAARAIRAPPWQ